MHDSMCLEGHLVGGAWWKIRQVLQVLDFSDLVLTSPLMLLCCIGYSSYLSSFESNYPRWASG